MFFFTRKYSLADSGIFRGFTDCHTHLLPGVDDGVRTPSASLEILSRMERAGVKELWLTPPPCHGRHAEHEGCADCPFQ